MPGDGPESHGQQPDGIRMGKGKRILVNLSGRGDKDIDFVMENYPLTEYEPEEVMKDGYDEFLSHIQSKTN